MGNCLHLTCMINSSSLPPTVKPIVTSTSQIEEHEQKVNDVTIVTPVTIKDITNIYKECTNENTPYYSYENIKKKVKILNVVDGDTVDIAFHHDEMNRVFKYRVRMYGIDTPEKRPLKSNPNREKEIEASHISKNALIQRLEENDYIVVALFYKPDKYGRLLATFYDKNGDDLNEWMVKSGYAYAYFGKTKQKFEEKQGQQGEQEEEEDINL